MERSERRNWWWWWWWWGELWCHNGDKSSAGLVALSRRVRQRAIGCHGMGPCLFNHEQLHSHRPSCEEITPPVMTTKRPRPQHTGNRLKPTRTSQTPLPPTLPLLPNPRTLSFQ